MACLDQLRSDLELGVGHMGAGVELILPFPLLVPVVSKGAWIS